MVLATSGSVFRGMHGFRIRMWAHPRTRLLTTSTMEPWTGLTPIGFGGYAYNVSSGVLNASRTSAVFGYVGVQTPFNVSGDFYGNRGRIADVPEHRRPACTHSVYWGLELRVDIYVFDHQIISGSLPNVISEDVSNSSAALTFKRSVARVTRLRPLIPLTAGPVTLHPWHGN